MSEAPDYLNPAIADDVRVVEIPSVVASDKTLRGFGHLVDAAQDVQIEIVRWPAQGRRPVDSDSGNEGGTVEGVFESTWKGDVLYGRNDAVGGHYVLGYGAIPRDAREDHTNPPACVLLWHANYHPDGGQLFMPLDRQPFVVPLAPPGDDVKPEDFVAFQFDGTRGLYIHPNIWHEGVFSTSGTGRFFDKQGAVHARVSVDFAREFGCLLKANFS